jgi:H+/gluconate symporter-like permease
MQILIGIIVGILFNFLFAGIFYAGFVFGKRSKTTPQQKIEVSNKEKIKREEIDKTFEQMMAYSMEHAVKKVGVGGNG